MKSNSAIFGTRIPPPFDRSNSHIKMKSLFLLLIILSSLLKVELKTKFLINIIYDILNNLC